MPDASSRQPIEPLFASNERLWLRVWLATQAAALAVSCYSMIGRAGGTRAFLASPAAARSLGLVALLVAYHAAGYRAHGWIMRRPWAVATFVPFGWAIIFASVPLSGGTFGPLVLGLVIQGFIFLPFAWAIGALGLVVSLLLAVIAAQTGRQGLSLTIASAGGVLATGIMMGTVMLYIHRVNRDATIREKLLRQLHDAQRDLAARAKEAGVQEERQRLALDIHDTLAQGFTSVIRHLEAIELSFASGGAADSLMQRAALHLEHAQAVSRSSLAEIRRLVWALRPPQLAESTLSAAIERIVTHWSGANDISARCNIGALPPLLPDADVMLLRATQEALSNVARHAHATRVAVGLHSVDGVVLLSVEDDGCGVADEDTVGAGTLGIAGMRERARRSGGHVLIESVAGAGTSITVAVPLAAIASQAP